MIIFFSDSRRGGEHIAKGKMDPRVALIKVTASKSYQKLINSNFDQTQAYDESYSKTIRGHKYKDKDNDKDNDKDKDTYKVPGNPTYAIFLKS